MIEGLSRAWTGQKYQPRLWGMTREQAAEVLTEIATLLELKGENPFKIRAYTNGARALESLAEPLEKLVKEDRLGAVPGLGEALQKKISELVTTGRLQFYEELQESTLPGLLEMLQIPGLGPKRIKTIHEALGIDSVEKLEDACRNGRLAALSGLGGKTQTRILEGIERRRQYASQFLISQAIPEAEELLEALRQHPAVVRCATAGSLRRHKEVIHDVDLMASSKRPEDVLRFFAALPNVVKTLALGDTKASVLLQSGLQADLRVVADKEFAAALLYFTGSKEHNVVMRQRAIARGLRLNEYGLFRSEVETRDPARRVECTTEGEIFRELGLSFIPPEMREDAGEFALAESGPIPRLVEWTDLKGSLHNHSTWSDGHMGIREIADAIQELGLSYWAITDHSKASFQANGLDERRLLEQLEEVRAINEELVSEGTDFRLLTGVEVDVLRDGRLDLEDELLAKLDVVVASVHQSFNLSEAENTHRLISAARNPFVTMLGHLTGRRLLSREPYAINHHAIIDACAETGTFIELNSNPKRLDMDWRFWPYAKRKGVQCVINCDAHRLGEAGFLRLGTGIARKAGLTKEDVLNTLPLPQLSQALRRKRAR